MADTEVGAAAATFGCFFAGARFAGDSAGFCTVSTVGAGAGAAAMGAAGFTSTDFLGFEGAATGVGCGIGCGVGCGFADGAGDGNFAATMVGAGVRDAAFAAFAARAAAAV